MSVVNVMADANFNRLILQGLRRRLEKIDIVTAQELGLEEEPDDGILDRAAAEGRVLLTHDKISMPPLVYQRVQQGLLVPGVIVVPQDMSIGRAIEELELLLAASLPGELENRVLWLPL